MIVWDQFVDLLRAGIFAYAQVCGGNLGMGIIAVTLLVRMALLPLTLRIARLSAGHQDAMRKLKPELQKIRSRFKDRPNVLAEEMRRLFEKEGVSTIPLGGCAGTLIQLPFLVGLFSAVRRCVMAGGQFLWIRNIAKPDLLISLGVTALTYLSITLGGNYADQNKTLMIVIPTVVTFIVIARMSAGIGLYWGISSLVNLLQTLIIRREKLLAARVL